MNQFMYSFTDFIHRKQGLRKITNFTKLNVNRKGGGSREKKDIEEFTSEGHVTPYTIAVAIAMSFAIM